jgi:SAM-dependent methyltransferase
MPCPTSPFLRLTEQLDNARRRVLIVGCGVSTEPALLARLGYEVVAFDVSQRAVKYVNRNPATDRDLAKWLTLELPDHATWQERSIEAQRDADAR